MNNTTTIRALTAIVVVVIITAGSLVAAAATSSSSSTLQPQNLICTHSGNNATCIQEGIIPATTQIPLPTPQQQPQPPPATLTVIKHVINDIVGTIFAKDFTSSAGSTNVSPQSSFPGATTTVTLKPANFSGPLLQQANATIVVVVADHNKCSSSGDIVNCTHNKETHYPAKDTTTPLVLPIPFP
jgi:hypothetical protein